MARLVYTARFVKRMPGLALRLTSVGIRRIVVRPVRWGINRGKTGLHAFLVWRKGEPLRAARTAMRRAQREQYSRPGPHSGPDQVP
jgi:hypothetical protein